MGISDRAPFKKGDVILGTYLVEDIRSGAMGDVYIAYHKKWKIKMAIKTPNEKILSDKGLFIRVLKEADAWIDLGLHPNIAYCYYLRQVDNVPYIFTEYVNGGNLREWIAAGKCHDLKLGLDLAIQFCHGMEQAHNHGMIHRDIKPANTLMTIEGILKVTDFGLVKTSGLDTPYAGVQGGMRGETQFASLMGTPAYMSPEQYETPLDIDRRTDIFSFGVCLYEMLCGRPPFEQTSAAYPASYIAKMARKSCLEPSKLRRDIPDELAKILKKCVSLERERRYSFFEELREDLTLLYRRLFGDNPPHADVETLNIKADGLNNRGASYLDLGREDDALKCWEEALRIDPAHYEAAYNHGYLMWSRAQMTQSDVLRRLEGCMDSAGYQKPEHWTALAWLYLEMGHLNKVEELQQTLNRQNNDKFLVAWNMEKQRLIRTFIGHADAVTSVVITPDGRFAISGSYDNTLKLWEIETGTEVRMFTGHTDRVTSVAITPDGRFAISGSYDDTLRLWDIATGKEVRKFTGHADIVSTVAVTHDGRYALSGSDDKTLKLWDIATGNDIKTLSGNAKEINSIAITPDSRWALSGSDDSLTLWEISTGKATRTFLGHIWGPDSITITSDGLFAVSGSNEDTLTLWEISTGKEIRTFMGHIAGVSSVAITSDSRFALSGSWDGTLKLWEICLPTIIDHLYPLIASVTEVSSDIQRNKYVGSLIEESRVFIKQGRYDDAAISLRKAQSIPNYERNSDILNMLAICRAKKVITVNGLINAWFVGSFTGHTDCVRSIAIMPNGKFALSGGWDNTLKLWEIASGQELRGYAGHTKEINSIVITPDGKYALSGSDDKTVKLWEIETGMQIRSYTGHTESVTSIAITPDGRYALSGGNDDTLKLWEIETGEEIKTFNGHSDWVKSVAITPDGRFALSGSYDNTLKLWEIETGKEIRTFNGHSDWVNSIAITPDGKCALSGSSDTMIKLWDLAASEIRTFTGHTEPVMSVVISPDGRFALSGSLDKSLKLWDITLGQEIKSLTGHTWSVITVAITRDGRYALSGSADDTVKIWEFDWDWSYNN